MSPPTHKPTILAVDDTPENLDLINGLLEKEYQMLGANSGKLALKVAAARRPNLILLDIMMPEMDGYEVCRELKQNHLTRDIPVIFLTAKTAVEDEAQGFKVGAVDYISKPISPPILYSRIATHLKIREYSSSLELMVKDRTEQLSETQDAIIFAMAALTEQRDVETGNHINRTQGYVNLLTVNLALQPKFSSYLTPEMVEMISKAAPLHDIGKVAVPDHILLKPGKYTDEEFEIMKTHSEAGRDVILKAESALSRSQEFLRHCREIAHYHHEKWDGSGYPDGLSGEDIPLSARIMALADVYDALVCKRVYKERFSQQKAIEIIKDGSGGAL